MTHDFIAHDPARDPIPPPLVKRTTLIVRSIERSIEFYRDVLGMSIWYDDEITLSGVGLAAGTKGDRTRLVIMQGPDPLLGMIGLLEFVAPRMAEPVRRERLGIGDIVFVMQGRDVHGFVTFSGQGNRFNVEALSPGLYTVQVRTARAHRVVRFLKN